MSNSTFRRVDREHRCPVCSRSDWCLIARDGSAVLCQRISEGSVRRVGEAGWLHRLRDRDGWQPSSSRRIVVPTVSTQAARRDLAELAERFRQAVTPDRLARLASDLGVSAESLARLGIGWCEVSRAWSFPMVDAGRNILGIRLRAESGKKFSVRGGREGLFVPDRLDGSGPLLIAEGPTDCAALLDLGFVAVGRPSCRGGRALVLDLVRRWRPASVVVVADNDAAGQGWDGAVNLARGLATRVADLRMISPPPATKDARAWLRAGATRSDVLDAIHAAPAHRVSLRTVRTDGGRHVG